MNVCIKREKHDREIETKKERKSMWIRFTVSQRLTSPKFCKVVSWKLTEKQHV